MSTRTIADEQGKYLDELIKRLDETEIKVAEASNKVLEAQNRLNILNNTSILSCIRPVHIALFILLLLYLLRPLFSKSDF